MDIGPKKHKHVHIAKDNSKRQTEYRRLKENGLEEYDEVRLFILADGRCAQDECYIRSITPEKLPERIKQRREKRMIAAVKTCRGKCLVCFGDEKVGMFNAEEYCGTHEKFSHLRKYAALLTELKKNAVGSELRFDNGDGIPYTEVYSSADMLPVKLDSLQRLAAESIFTAAEMAEGLGCTRQNINDFIKRGKIVPIDIPGKRVLFSGGDFMKLM